MRGTKLHQRLAILPPAGLQFVDNACTNQREKGREKKKRREERGGQKMASRVIQTLMDLDWTSSRVLHECHLGPDASN
jgi:hypothetical protein